jgi:acyl-CoA dehydrogenase
MARRMVEEELLPLEPKYLLSPDRAHGRKEILNLRATFPAETVSRLEKLSQDSGLWYFLIPEKFGGMGLSLLAQVVVLEQFNYTYVPFPFANVPSILYACKDDQVDRFLMPVIHGTKTTAFAQTEPDAGSDPGGMMKTRAVKDGSDWIINGTKMWISNAADSDILLVLAVTDPEKRQRGGITMFLVDRHNPGVHIEEPGIQTWLSPRPAQYIVHFNDCRVSERDVMGDVGKGFNLGQQRLMIDDRLMRGPIALGKMQRAFDMSVAWAKQRVTFGRPIAERQAIQWKLVDMHVDMEALRSMTYQAAARSDAGADIRSEASLVKLISTEWGARSIDQAIQIHGAMGESSELPLTAFYRALRHAQIGGGTSEIQRHLIARKILA